MKTPLRALMAASLSRLRRAGAEVFFVVGHPRSGTNWVCNLLNLHPRVFCDGEFHFQEVLRAVERSSAETWQACGREPARSTMRRGFEEMVRQTVRSAASVKPGARMAGDRTPRHLEPLIDGARNIVCVRDGRDVLVSWTFHLLIDLCTVKETAGVPKRLENRLASEDRIHH